MSRSVGELMQAEAQAKEEITLLHSALNEKDYSNEFHFEFKPALTHADFNHPGLKELVEGCNAAHVYMHPDLVAQTIESELFERMKGFVKTHVSGKSVTYLMEMKNDLERKMLKDQLASREKRLVDVQAELAAFELKVAEPAIDVDAMARSFNLNNAVEDEFSLDVNAPIKASVNKKKK